MAEIQRLTRKLRVALQGRRILLLIGMHDFFYSDWPLYLMVKTRKSNFDKSTHSQVRVDALPGHLTNMSHVVSSNWYTKNYLIFQMTLFFRFHN